MRRIVALVLGLLACLALVEGLVVLGQWVFVRTQARENQREITGAAGEVRRSSSSAARCIPWLCSRYSDSLQREQQPALWRL